MICSKCQNKISEGDEFCGYCGQKVANNKQEKFLNKYRLRNIDLSTAEKHIRNAYIAGAISIGITVLAIYFGIFDSIYWFDVIIFALLVSGVYRKNTFSAVVLVIYFLIGKTFQFIELGYVSFWPMIVALIFLNYYYLGVLGVIKYNRLVDRKKSNNKNLILGIIYGVLAAAFIGYLVYTMFFGAYIDEDYLTPLSQEQISAVVMLVCIGDDGESISYGSGVIVNSDEGNIITNRHVVTNNDWSIIETSPTCHVGVTEDISQPPVFKYYADLVAYSPEPETYEEEDFDIAVLDIYDVCPREECEDAPLYLPSSFPYLEMGYSDELVLGSYVSVLGYPETGGGTFNFTEGILSGRLGDFILKTDAKIDSGNSGGAALNGYNQLIGIPSWALLGEAESIGYIIGIDAIYDWFENKAIPSGSVIVPFGIYSGSNESLSKIEESYSNCVTQKAKGVVTIFSLLDVPQKMIATTRLLSSSGLLFRINEDIFVPAAKTINGKLIPGQLEVSATADGKGLEYEIEPDTFSIPGFDYTEKYNKFYAESYQSMSCD